MVASVIVGGKDKDPGNSADDYASLTFRNHLAYCRRHGYDYVLRTRAYDRMDGGARTAQWDKIRLVVSLLERGYRLVFWTDSDSLFTRCGQSIEAAVGLATQPHADFFFTGDHNYALNSGQFLVRNTPWASAFLERWWAAGDDAAFLHSSCHDHLDNGGGIFALFALVAGREHCGDGHRLSRHDRKACEAECNQLMRGRYVTTADCSRLHAAFNRTARVRCLPQTAINSYYVGRDGNDWWPGHFRVHVPGNQRVKLVKLRLDQLALCASASHALSLRPACCTGSHRSSRLVTIVLPGTSSITRSTLPTTDVHPPRSAAASPDADGGAPRGARRRRFDERRSMLHARAARVDLSGTFRRPARRSVGSSP